MPFGVFAASRSSCPGFPRLLASSAEAPSTAAVRLQTSPRHGEAGEYGASLGQVAAATSAPALPLHPSSRSLLEREPLFGSSSYMLGALIQVLSSGVTDENRIFTRPGVPSNDSTALP